MFPAATGRFRAVVLFSDGEAQSGNANAAAQRARELNIPIFTVVTGTADGATIPLANGGVVHDRNGKVVVTRADPRLMRNIARASGGRSFSLSDPAVFSALLSSIQKLAGLRSSEGFRLVDIPRYAIFLGLALFFLFLSLGVRVVKWKDVF
jgi:Ca-activated chloride channel family protein